MQEVLGRWKESLVAKINMYVSAPASSLASGMLFGATSMSKELTQTFRIAGLSHIVVLSGFNIAILIAGVLFVLTFFPLLLRVFISAVVVIFFVMMVGGEASVIRAVLMAFIALLAQVFGRQYVAHQALIISFLLIIMYEPYSLLHDVSLHLSFLATAGIIYLAEPITVIYNKYFSRINSKTFCVIFVTTASAYLATLPYISYTFGTVSVYALVANVLVLPFVPVAMLLSFLVVVSSYVSHTISLLFGFVDSIIINFILFVSQMIEKLPFSAVTITISFEGMIIFYFAIVTVISYLYKKNNFSVTQIEKGKENILTDIIKY